MAPTRALPLFLVEEGGVAAAGLGAEETRWAAANGFSGQRGRLLPLPGSGGALSGFAFGVGGSAGRSPLVAGLAAAQLDPGRYRLEGAIGDPTLAALGFRLGACEHQPTAGLALLYMSQPNH